MSRSRPTPQRRVAPTVPRRSIVAFLALGLAAAACSDPSGPRGGGGGDPGGASAYDLVDQALASGRIDAETALLQKIFATLGDPRLDPRFRDPELARRTSIPDPLPGLLRAAAGRLPTLSPAAQRVLAPYFQPPRYAGSAWVAGSAPGGRMAGASASGAAAGPVPGPEPVPQEGWSHVDAPAIPVRVWVHPAFSQGAVTPERVIHELQSKSWPVLSELMGRAPLDDGGPHAFTGADGNPYTWGDGGDGRFDIYLISPSSLGLRSGGAVTVAYPPGCGARPGFMLLNADLNETDRPLGPSLAHELFHALQFAFPREVPCDDEWDESTAQWASHYVYPRWDPRPADLILFDPHDALVGPIGYWKWLFNAYLQHAHSPALVRATHEAYATAPSAMHALDAALPGGLRRHMAEFAVHAWNGAPGDASFADWEGVTRRTDDRYLARHAVTVRLAGAARATGEVAAAPWPLTRAYDPIGVADEGVRWLEITNPYAGRSNPRITLQAWVRIRGAGWRLEDWSDRSRVSFCRGRAAERVDSLILVQADYTVQAGGAARPPLRWEARDQCPEGYSITVRDRGTSELHGTTYDVAYTARVATPPSGTGDMVGAGSYTGTIVTRKANCENGLPDDPRSHAVAGQLRASAGAEGPDGWFGYVLETLDWDFMTPLGRPAETAAEREAARGLGTVGSLTRPLLLSGGRAERTDTLSRGWSDCFGSTYMIRTTTVMRDGGG